MADIFSSGLMQSFTEEDREEYLENQEKGEEDVSELADDEDEQEDETDEEQDSGDDSEDTEEDIEDEPDEEEGEETDEDEDSEEESDEDEDYEMTVTYKSAEGKDVEKTIKQSDLPELLKKAESPADEEYIDFIRDATPFVENLNKSILMQHVDYYLSRGYSDKEIQQGLYQMWQKTFEQQPQEEEDVDIYDKDTFNRKVEETVQKRIAPIENHLKQQQQQQYTNSIIAHNDNTFAKALQNHGYNPNELSQEQRDALKEAFITYYGNDKGQVDVANIKYQQHQLNGVVKAALVDQKFGNKPEEKKTKGSRPVVRKKVPKIAPGNASTKRGNAKIKIPKIDNVSIQDRRANWKNL